MGTSISFRLAALFTVCMFASGCGLNKDLLKQRWDKQGEAASALSAAQREMANAKRAGGEKYGQPEYNEAQAHLTTATQQKTVGDANTGSRNEKDKSYKKNNNQTSFKTAMAAYEKSIQESRACIQKAKVAQARAIAAQAIEAAKRALVDAESEGALEHAADLFKKAKEELAGAEEAYAKGDFKNAKILADQAAATAKAARDRAVAEKARLAREKGARDKSWDRVKELQAQLADALKGSNYEKILDLMVRLCEAEVDYANMTDSHGLGGKDQVAKYSKQREAAVQLRQRYREAVETYEDAKRKLNSAKRKREAAESELDLLRKRVEDAKSLMESKESEMERLKADLQKLETE